MRLPSDVWALVLPLENFWDVISCLHSTQCQRILEEVLCVGWRWGGRERWGSWSVCMCTKPNWSWRVTMRVHALCASLNIKYLFLLYTALYAQTFTWAVPDYVLLCIYVQPIVICILMLHCICPNYVFLQLSYANIQTAADIQHSSRQSYYWLKRLDHCHYRAVQNWQIHALFIAFGLFTSGQVEKKQPKSTFYDWRSYCITVRVCTVC